MIGNCEHRLHSGHKNNAVICSVKTNDKPIIARKEVSKATDYGTIIDLIIDILVIVRDGLDSSKD